MSSSNRLIAAILAVALLAVGFWVLLLSPKREEVDKLSSQLDSLNSTLVQAQSAVAVAEEAERSFPDDYRQLVALGEAVPEGDETSSLLVELNQIARDSKVTFSGFTLASGGEAAPAEAVAPEPPPQTTTEPSGAVPAAATVPPTEAAAALLPLGSTIGPAGLAVMPYTLTFSGSFFEIADFIAGIDGLVDPETVKVGVNGRLITIDGFALTTEAAEPGEPPSGELEASFVVTTFVVSPSQGITAGATPTEPAPAVPASGSPEAESSEETVAAQ